MAAVLTSAILRRADELVVEHGWTQGTMWGLGGRMCVMGATLVAAYQLGDTDQYVSADRYIRRVLGGPIAPWNDDLATTEAHVHDVLHEAELLAKADEP